MKGKFGNLLPLGNLHIHIQRKHLLVCAGEAAQLQHNAGQRSNVKYGNTQYFFHSSVYVFRLLCFFQVKCEKHSQRRGAQGLCVACLTSVQQPSVPNGLFTYRGLWGMFLMISFFVCFLELDYLHNGFKLKRGTCN